MSDVPVTSDPVTIDDVYAAADRIAGKVRRTPVVTSPTLDEELSAEVFFKCENLQVIGAFKARGATNAVFSLPDDVARRGVVTHSSGNHGAALAYAAAARGIPCTVVVPHDASPVKVANIRRHGAAIEFCGQMERDEVCARVQAETGAVMVHPFDDPAVIAGQATATLELCAQVPDLDAVVAPIGGGGLLSGAAVVAGATRPEAAIFGAEPEAVDDAYRSLVTGVRQPRVPDAVTLGDGLLTGIGEIPFTILMAAGAEIITVSEEDIVAACRFFLTDVKLVVEPSGATTVAALRTRGGWSGRRVGVILSGGNTDFGWL